MKYADRIVKISETIMDLLGFHDNRLVTVTILMGQGSIRSVKANVIRNHPRREGKSIKMIALAAEIHTMLPPPGAGMDNGFTGNVIISFQGDGPDRAIVTWHAYEFNIAI